MRGDVTEAVSQAKAAAGDKAVQGGSGANVIQQLPRAEVVDELPIGIMPVLLDAGLRLFNFDEAPAICLEKGGQAAGQRSGFFRVRVVT